MTTATTTTAAFLTPVSTGGYSIPFAPRDLHVLSRPHLSRPSLHPLRSSSLTERRSEKTRVRRSWTAPRAKKSPLDRIPKQFREENFPDGLKDNYMNFPYLSPSQLAMLSNNTFDQASDSSNGRSPRYKMSFFKLLSSMSWKGIDKSPDWLDHRIIYLDSPLWPEVSSKIYQQLLFLYFVDDTEPVHLYINSTGTQDDMDQPIASESDVYAIVDFMRVHAAVYTVNVGQACGQAALLLSLGKKGHRALFGSTFTRLYLPSVHRSSGTASDVWMTGQELNVNAQLYIELLAEGTGRPKEQVANYLQRSRLLNSEKAIQFGVADRILTTLDNPASRKEYEALEQERRAQIEAGVVPVTGIPGLDDV